MTAFVPFLMLWQLVEVASHGPGFVVGDACLAVGFALRAQTDRELSQPPWPRGLVCTCLGWFGLGRCPRHLARSRVPREMFTRHSRRFRSLFSPEA